LKKNRVIITYGWCRVAYAALRCLSAQGLEVIVGGPQKQTMAGSSKFAFNSFVYPSPYTDPEGFVRKIAEVAVEFDAGVFIPIHEEVIAVAKYRDLLPSDLIVPISSYDQIMTAYDKGLTMGHAAKVGVSIPDTIHPESIDNAIAIADELEYPVWIKLRKSNSAKGVFKINTADQLKHRYPEIVDEYINDPECLPIIQQHLEGKVYSVSVLLNRGELVTKFVRKNIREKTYGGGTCTKCVSVSMPVLEAEAEKMMTSLNWHGVAMLEFKYDEVSEKGFLLEINPRYHGTIDHDIQSGVPTPYLHYLVGTQAELPSIPEYKIGFSSRWLIGDLIGVLDHLSKAKTFREKLSYLGKICKFNEDSYMDIKRDDLKPFFVQSWFYLSKFIKTRSRNPVDDGMVG
jgi:predicted ATP-grasp superfamily ATP-dependent carboligase